MTIGPVDVVLVLVVSTQSAVVAYLHDPKWKAFVLTLPLPFTVASLSVGIPVNASHVLGLILLLLFSHLVKVLHYDVRAPIVPSIVAAALTYCLLGWFINRVLPQTELVFWLACAGVAGTALIARALSRPYPEPGHRSSLPVWLKWIIVTAVVVLLLLIKKRLQGFMAVFPMVGVVAAYEARKSLRTIARQIPSVMITLLALMATAHLAGRRLGLGASLAVGWAAFLVLLWLVTPWSELRGEGGHACSP